MLAALTGRRGLRVWSEMFSDGALALDKAGALDTDQPVIASFAFGSPELYDWMDRNPNLRMLRTETTNDPAQIERHQHMVSVNAALQVDLFAEANASWVGEEIYSGFGGQTDFVVGALHSPDGLAIVAVPSWHPKADVSTVVPRLTGPVTSFQHSFIVSDQGTAAIWGHDASAQAEQIITTVAHPRGPRRAARGRARPGFPGLGRRSGPKVPGARDTQPYPHPRPAAHACVMAQGKHILLTTGLARVEGEHVMYARASDNLPGWPPRCFA